MRINPTQRLTPTGRRAITRSRSRARTRINRLSLVLTVEFGICRSLNNCLGYPHGRLSVVKHRQLARQVGDFGGFASESSMDLDNMIFPMGSTFIFGSWICEAGDNGKLQGRLLEDSDHHEDLSISATMTDQLTGRFAQLVMSDPTQISWLCASDSNSGSASEMESYPSSFYDGLSSFSLGLRNTTSVHQEFNSGYLQNPLKKSGHGTTTSNYPTASSCLSQRQASCPTISRAGSKPVVRLHQAIAT